MQLICTGSTILLRDQTEQGYVIKELISKMLLPPKHPVVSSHQPDLIIFHTFNGCANLVFLRLVVFSWWIFCFGKKLLSYTTLYTGITERTINDIKKGNKTYLHQEALNIYILEIHRKIYSHLNAHYTIVHSSVRKKPI